MNIFPDIFLDSVKPEWAGVSKGCLVASPDRGKRNMAYTKPAQVDSPTEAGGAEPPRW